MSLPWKYFIYNSFKNNFTFPEYNPYVFSGLPFASNIQSGLFYPIDIFFYFIEPLKSFKITFFLNYIIYLFGCYLLISYFSKKNIVVLFGMISLGFCWFAVYFAPLKQVFNAYIWLPLIFYYLFRYLDKEQWADVLKYSIVLVFSILGGHPQFPYYALIFSGLIILIYLIYDLKKIKILWRLIIAAIIVILLTLPQIYSTYKFSKIAARSSANSYYFATDGSVKPSKLINILIPDFYGNIADGTAWGNFWRPLKQVHTHIEFLGILPIILLIFGLTKSLKENKRYYLFIFLGIFALLISLGRYAPLFRILFDVLPGVSNFRSPKRILYFYDIFITIAAAISLQIFCENSEIKNANILKKILQVLMIVFFVFFVADIFSRSRLIEYLQKIGHSEYLKKNNHYHNWQFYSAFINNAVNHSIKQLYIFFAFAIGYILSLLLANKRRKYLIFTIALFIVELHWFNFRFFDNIPNSELVEKMNFYEKKIVSKKDARILSLVPLDHLLALNGSIFYDIESARGYDPLVEKYYIDYFRGIETNMRDVHPNTEISRPDINSQLLDLLNIGYIYSDLEINAEQSKLEFLEKYKDLYIYRRSENIGYAKFYNDAIVEKDLEKSYEMLKNNVISVKDKLILNEDIDDDTIIENNVGRGIIKKIERVGGSVKISGYNKGSRYLFISEKFTNFDKMYYNGSEKKKYRCNNMFICAALKDGEFEIVLLREKNTLKILIVFAVISFFIALLLVKKCREYE